MAKDTDEFIRENVPRGTASPETRKTRLPLGVQRAVSKAQESRTVVPVPGIGEARQFMSGFIGTQPDYSVMDPNYKALGSAYRTGEQTSVAADVFGALTPFATASALSKASQIPGIAELIAYHGSPHRFKKFDASKIGTGEGAQAYGHGLYFAENPKVAKDYADVLASPRNMVSDKRGVYIEPSPVTSGKYMLATKSEVGQPYGVAGDATQFIYSDHEFPNIASAIKFAKRQGLLSKNDRPRLTAIGEDRKYIPVTKASDVENPEYTQFIASDPGSIYTVDIPDEKIAQMLDWDKPLSQQPKAFQDVVSSLPRFQDPYVASKTTGGEAYGELAGKLGGRDKAAESLRQAGIPGIKYLDQVSRNKPLKDIKREFLNELPEDASIDEVVELLGTGTFSPKNEAIIKELAANDWLGFDYPAQSLSTVLSPSARNYDLSPSLMRAINEAQEGGTRNFVLFPGEEQNIKMLDINGEPLEKQDGGEVTTEEFIRENVPRGTSEVPRLTPEGQLIDEREEIRSESQRMLNRLQSQPSKLPPGIRRTVAATREQGKESMFPAAAPARDLLSGILGASPTVPGSQAYRTGQAIANMPPVQAAAAIPAKIAASAGDAATALAAMGPAVGAVMKPKGGNWLAPSVERGLNYLIPRTGAGNRTAKETLEEMNRTYPAEELARMPETRAAVDRAYRRLEPNVAIQNWIEKKLTKYVKNEMATPEDPVRALAERGILHVDPEQLNSYPGAGNPTNQAVSRRALSYPEEGLAKSEAAKKWETASDYMIQTDRALNLLNPKEYGQGFVDQTLAANPWLTKVDPYERIYGVDTLNYRPDYSELGFDHLIDELKNSLNPNSGLPRALQLTPKQLDKVSVPQAVELVDKINKWRAEQKAAADLKRSQNAATVEYKAYETIPGTAEPNQRGLRWVELKTPEFNKLPLEQRKQMIERLRAEAAEKGMSPEDYIEQYPRKILEDALKYEGETMGHCVGGYCPDVEEGRSRIYSLRDKKGEPHVTIEVQPTGYTFKDIRAAVGDDAANEMLERGLDLRAMAKEIGYKPQNQNIVQIKGKANRAPKDEYLPFVQDFVRSGQWSSVGDFKNTGLIRKSDYIDTFTPEMLDSVGVGEYMTKEEFNQLADKLGGINKMATGGAVRMKDGGEVNVPRETSTSKQQLDKLAQVSKRKKA